MFVVTAVEVGDRCAAPFSNRRAEAPAVTIEPRHVLASGSLPPGYPGRNRTACRTGTAALSTIRRSAWPVDAFRRCRGRPDARRHDLYPLRARLPRNLAAVEDRLHELNFGNRLRQDHDMARRINALVETIDELAARSRPTNAAMVERPISTSAALQGIRDCDRQHRHPDPAATLADFVQAQSPADDKDGIASCRRARSPQARPSQRATRGWSRAIRATTSCGRDSNRRSCARRAE